RTRHTSRGHDFAKFEGRTSRSTLGISRQRSESQSNASSLQGASADGCWGTRPS
ncbi:unnamed protein product, partial [Ascophyllum nodosum]